VSKPEDPVREGYTFADWYADEALTEAYDFGSAVNEDTVLYAKWTEDGGAEQPNPPVDPEDPNKPGKPEDPNKPVDPNKPGKPGADNKPGKPGLPQTGDNTLFMVGGIAVVAVAALVAGFYLKRRRS
ncbi:MAG: InlB B-repeat-containing protein, partial [Acutalibacteraceae bacterium]|nr:InlB B-repeat-containing protein [Acutalibacteraceae bacterium]